MENEKEKNLKTTQPLFFSCGYRCSSAAFLKRLGLKHESYPFDWCISRLSVIKDSIENEFQEFLSLDNYEKRHTNTYEMMNSNNGWVCDEYIIMNHFYQPKNQLHEDNTYHYYLAMNHHDITQEKDHAYYKRCVERFNQLFNPMNILPKFFVHITPLITLKEYTSSAYKNILKECMDFSDYLYEKSRKTARGLFFVMVRDDQADNMRQELFWELNNGSEIYVIFANKNFVDAGEFFMGLHYQEYNFIMDVLRNHAFQPPEISN
jgi:hypothetical protein